MVPRLTHLKSQSTAFSRKRESRVFQGIKGVVVFGRGGPFWHWPDINCRIRGHKIPAFAGMMIPRAGRPDTSSNASSLVAFAVSGAENTAGLSQAGSARNTGIFRDVRPWYSAYGGKASTEISHNLSRSASSWTSRTRILWTSVSSWTSTSWSALRL